MGLVIRHEHTSFKEIAGDLTKFLESRPYYEDIKDRFPSSNMELILNLIAGFGEWSNYLYQTMRRESYLSKATQASSIYNLAYNYGYNINRGSAPIVQVQYNDVPTIEIKNGQLLGTYKGLDVIYFGETTLIEKGDRINCILGRFKQINSVTNTISEPLMKFDLHPEELDYIDNDNMKLTVGITEVPISRIAEDFIAYHSCIDFSKSISSTIIYVYDVKNNFGIKASDNLPVTLKYFETSGRLTVFDPKFLALVSKFSFVKLETRGDNGDSLEKIKFLAPLFFSTARRAVTVKDYVFISKAFPNINDVYVTKDLGIPGQYEIRLKSIVSKSATYSVVVQDYNHTVISDRDSDDSLFILDQLYNKLRLNTSIISKIDRIKKIITVIPREAFSKFSLKTSDNLIVDTIRSHTPSKPCTINIFYLLQSTIDDMIAGSSEVVSLSEHEQQKFMSYIMKFKLVGITIILLPATCLKKTLKFLLKLSDYSLRPVVEKEIEKILSWYEFKIGASLKYGEILSKIANIEIISEHGEKISPIISILPDQDVFNIEADPKVFFKFDKELKYI